VRLGHVARKSRSTIAALSRLEARRTSANNRSTLGFADRPSFCDKWNPPDKRIFSLVAGAGLCDPIGRYMYLFKRLAAVSEGVLAN